MARPVGRPIDFSEQVGPVLFGAALAVVLLALGGVPYLLAPPRAPSTTSAISQAGTALPPADAKVLENAARARFAGTDSARELEWSPARGVTNRILRIRVLSAGQLGSSGSTLFTRMLSDLVERNRTAGYEQLAMVTVTYTSSGYFRDTRTGSGVTLNTKPGATTSYLGYGKKSGRWYDLGAVR